MTEGLTTSANTPTGKITKLSKEQKAKQKEQDEDALRSYNLQLDISKTELDKWETALKLDLPNREAKENIKNLKDQVTKFEMYKDIVRKRLGKK